MPFLYWKGVRLSQFSGKSSMPWIVCLENWRLSTPSGMWNGMSFEKHLEVEKTESICHGWVIAFRHANNSRWEWRTRWPLKRYGWRRLKLKSPSPTISFEVVFNLPPYPSVDAPLNGAGVDGHNSILHGPSLRSRSTVSAKKRYDIDSTKYVWASSFGLLGCHR